MYYCLQNTHEHKYWIMRMCCRSGNAWKGFVMAKLFCMCYSTFWTSVHVLTTVEPYGCHDMYVIIFFPTWTFKTESPEANEYYIQDFILLVLSLSSRAIIPYSHSLALHDKHLGSVSAASASCFALACWNGRRAGVLFITVLFGKA